MVAGIAGAALGNGAPALGDAGVSIGAGCGITGNEPTRPPSVVCGNGGLDGSWSTDTGGGALVAGTPATPPDGPGVDVEEEPDAWPAALLLGTDGALTPDTCADAGVPALSASAIAAPDRSIAPRN